MINRIIYIYIYDSMYKWKRKSDNTRQRRLWCQRFSCIELGEVQRRILYCLKELGRDEAFLEIERNSRADERGGVAVISSFPEPIRVLVFAANYFAFLLNYRRWKWTSLESLEEIAQAQFNYSSSAFFHLALQMRSKDRISYFYDGSFSHSYLFCFQFVCVWKQRELFWSEGRNCRRCGERLLRAESPNETAPAVHDPPFGSRLWAS